MTVDNASSNDSMITYLRRKIKGWKGVVLGGEFLHVRCCAHIVNLIVNEDLKYLHDSIAAIRNVVRYVRSSPARLLKFKSCVEREKIEYKGLICLDVSTRWNSTYMMLDAAIKFQKAFERYEEEDDNATLNVTSNSYFHELCEMQNQLSELSKQEDSMLSSMAVSMKKKYDKYWGNVKNINCLLFVAVVLDPRYKMDYLTYYFSIVYHSCTSEILVKNVKDTMYRLHEVYSGKNGESVANESSGEAATSTTEGKTKVEGKGCLWSKFVRKMKEKNVNEYKNDVDRYLTDHMEDLTRSNFDILDWWKNNATNYKVLSLVARDILVILVSTVASESAFSTRGRILDPFKSSLSPKIVEALICTQN
ncbi:zinc finger BED domain-containing protein RICESLEEPER 2-like [Morus notabilis]|uniref:zinc finger BED domain-containing protein RICESLEEPER 2-like n=1 Tax=Morus notabilis TaxID=981085 RepID=UPI000CED74AA|nr:zinc finger BED domain-containing protein RICESLEEPER 2-like [Morus notabilis]